MASNDKAPRAASSMPLATQVISGGRSSLSINIPKAFLGLAFLMLGILGVNLGLACSLTFDCGKFIPGPGYLGCFRGYDRFFIAACSYYGLILPVMFVGYYARFNGLVSEKKRNGMLLIGLGICASLPILSMTDEKNAVHVLPFEIIYTVSCWVLVVGSVVWTFLAYKCVSQSKALLNTVERRWFICLRILLLLAVFLGVATLVEWRYSYTKHEGYWVNALMGAKCEWALTVLSVLGPVVFCQFLRGFSISFTTQVSATYERLEVEMKKLES